ncbi:MAG: hypothetical protein RIR00_1333 [Pseudomonadota bacterium]|jgi:RND family efflux transporter MFP subunit
MRAAAASLAFLLLAACGKTEAPRSGPPATLITTTQASRGPLQIYETTLGTVEALQDPRIGAEVAGKVIRVLARAGQSVRAGQVLAEIDPRDYASQHQADQGEVARLEALLAQQDKLLARQDELVRQQFISRNALDDSQAQRQALRAQLDTARARAGLSERSRGKALVRAPHAGQIEEQSVAAGDYVKIGDPLFRLLGSSQLRAHLPFPESAAPRLRPGQKVRLRSPLAPETLIEAEVEALRPGLSEGSRALDLLVRLPANSPLRAGASVDAQVEVGNRPDAVTVPEQAVVLRPAGRVVYQIVDGKALQRPVRVGSKADGRIEILEGLAGSETLALDGAGFLSDGAAVSLRNAAKP